MHVAAGGAELGGAALDNDEHPGIVNRRFGPGLVAAGLPARSPNQFAVTLYDGMGALESLVHPSRFCFDGAAVAEDASGTVALAGGEPGTPLCLRFVDPHSGDSSDSLSFVAPDPDPGTRIVPYGTWIQLFGLAGGGIAIFANGVPIYVAQPSSNAIVRAPEWLTSHPRETFRVVRGGTANALARSDVAGSVITLVSPAGEVCGTISVTDFAFGDIGPDGTLVGSTGPAGAVKVWWPGLLR
jgi:hypothetical protein